jgi:hypothetical protein
MGITKLGEASRVSRSVWSSRTCVPLLLAAVTQPINTIWK